MSDATTTSSEVRFHHWPNTHLTMAVMLRTDGQVAVGLAKAGRKDQWSRAKGRLIAGNRARCERPGARHRFVLPNFDMVDPATGFVKWERVVSGLAASRDSLLPYVSTP